MQWIHVPMVGVKSGVKGGGKALIVYQKGTGVMGSIYHGDPTSYVPNFIHPNQVIGGKSGTHWTMVVI